MFTILYFLSSVHGSTTNTNGAINIHIPHNVLIWQYYKFKEIAPEKTYII